MIPFLPVNFSRIEQTSLFQEYHFHCYQKNVMLKPPLFYKNYIQKGKQRNKSE